MIFLQQKQTTLPFYRSVCYKMTEDEGKQANGKGKTHSTPSEK